MTVLLPSSIRPKRKMRRRTAAPSIREVCLLGADQVSNQMGDRVRRSGRIYHVAATQPAASQGAPGYVHLSCLGEG